MLAEKIENKPGWSILLPTVQRMIYKVKFWDKNDSQVFERIKLIVLISTVSRMFFPTYMQTNQVIGKRETLSAIVNFLLSEFL